MRYAGNYRTIEERERREKLAEQLKEKVDHIVKTTDCAKQDAIKQVAEQISKSKSYVHQMYYFG